MDNTARNWTFRRRLLPADVLQVKLLYLMHQTRAATLFPGGHYGAVARMPDAMACRFSLTFSARVA